MDGQRDEHSLSFICTFIKGLWGKVKKKEAVGGGGGREKVGGGEVSLMRCLRRETFAFALLSCLPVCSNKNM